LTFNPEESVNLLYDAVAAPETWTSALHRIARAAGSVGCLFLSAESESVARTLPTSPDAADFIREYVEDRWWEIDLTAQRGWPLVRRRSFTFLSDDDLSSAADRATNQYYQDFRFKWSFRRFGAVGFKVDGKEWRLSLLRTARQNDFSSEEAKRLADVALLFTKGANICCAS
jgi:hypothetical protein